MLKLILNGSPLTIFGHAASVFVHCNDYYVDKEGVTYDKMPHGDVYECGDLIIETPFEKYIFKRIYDAYMYLFYFNEAQEAQKDKPIVFIDLDKAPNLPPLCATGGVEVVPKLPLWMLPRQDT